MYSSEAGSDNRGMIVSLYLMGYGLIRFVLETIRNEKIVAHDMTLAQWSMGIFFAIGFMIMIYIHIKKYVRKFNATKS